MERRIKIGVMKKRLKILTKDYLQEYKKGWRGGPKNNEELIRDFMAWLSVHYKYEDAKTF